MTHRSSPLHAHTMTAARTHTHTITAAGMDLDLEVPPTPPQLPSLPPLLHPMQLPAPAGTLESKALALPTPLA